MSPSSRESMRMPRDCRASSWVPRATKATSCPPRASSPPKKAPTAPAPNTTIFMRPVDGRRGSAAARSAACRCRTVLHHHVADDCDRPPWRAELVDAVGANDRELLTKDADALFFAGDRDRHALQPRGGHRLQPRRAASAGNPLDEIRLRAEL